MKKEFILLAFSCFAFGCNNSAKDSVEIADSTNQALQDSAINNNKPVVEEAGSIFLVRVTDTEMAEARIIDIAMKKAIYQPVKDYAAKLNKEHAKLNEQIKNLSTKKMIVLPESISDVQQRDVDMIDKLEGKELDKTFINMMISKHQNSIEIFEKAIQEVADYEIKTFAEKTLPILKSQLEMAKSLHIKYQ